jgi:hypothetical protein
MITNDINLNTSIEKRCCCTECNNKTTKFLRITWMPHSGFFCEQCALDLMWHGISQAEEDDDDKKDDLRICEGVRQSLLLNQDRDKTANGK